MKSEIIEYNSCGRARPVGMFSRRIFRGSYVLCQFRDIRTLLISFSEFKNLLILNQHLLGRI